MKVWADVATMIKIAAVCVVLGMTLGFCLAGGALLPDSTVVPAGTSAPSLPIA